MSRSPALALAGVIALLGGCSGGSTPAARSSPATAAPSVSLPPADRRGPQVEVEGTVTWTTSHPGCVVLQTTGGQLFHLTGAVVPEHEHRARAGGQPVVQRVRITGYVPEVGASVCSARRAFVTEKVTVVDHP